MTAKLSRAGMTATSSAPRVRAAAGVRVAALPQQPRPAKATSTPIGTLTRNTHRQLPYSMSSAPIVGPTAAAAAPIAAWVATATGRRAGGTSGSSRARAVGTTSAANRPCSARPAISTLGSGANPHSR
jgi:hypothetical protein